MTINPQSEIRKDYLSERYVIISPRRQQRPRDNKNNSLTGPESSCPFCKENITKKNIVDQIDSKNDWNVLALKNIYPALSLDNEKAYGSQEVIIDHPEHKTEFSSLSILEIENVLTMYAKRTAALSTNSKLDYILCFKNQGFAAGASLAHIHSQVFASAMVPPLLLTELSAANHYFRKNNACPYCDIQKKEMQGPRKVWENKHVSVFTPYASEHQYEVWLFTKRHLDNISLANKVEIKSLATALSLVCQKIHALGFAYNLYMHQLVTDDSQHFYIKIQPRANIWAGIELGSGLIINPVSPEAAAEDYREFIEKL
jgi:UDPglucose--hexose-1-phosphate uridylyltransferase